MGGELSLIRLWSLLTTLFMPTTKYELRSLELSSLLKMEQTFYSFQRFDIMPEVSEWLKKMILSIITVEGMILLRSSCNSLSSPGKPLALSFSIASVKSLPFSTAFSNEPKSFPV